ncbi:hypothetical protein HaLaN_27330 [Haematococcus lacustris]|uniref:Uncharacterized protein n=1 Tax=Haematococcus lacustris TaxID=44745 RepID=A0A6A0A8N4_HAELA|nr:hypothetical protein HaLaN_27330 [Haematococcus lacustris]
MPEVSAEHAGAMSGGRWSGCSTAWWVEVNNGPSQGHAPHVDLNWAAESTLLFQGQVRLPCSCAPAGVTCWLAMAA